MFSRNHRAAQLQMVGYRHNAKEVESMTLYSALVQEYYSQIIKYSCYWRRRWVQQKAAGHLKKGRTGRRWLTCWSDKLRCAQLRKICDFEQRRKKRYCIKQILPTLELWTVELLRECCELLRMVYLKRRVAWLSRNIRLVYTINFK